ncbi:MAG: hypothetical protein J6N72_02640 [Psychrobacter sp.]|nr:hypothetical protein [Psychrobacter sp.]
MNSLISATNDLINSINNNMPRGGFLTLEIGVTPNGATTIRSIITSGSYSRRVVYFSITGVITDGDYDVTKYTKCENINSDVLIAFRELMFSVNAILSDKKFTSAVCNNGIMAFNAIIKPWSVEISHIVGTEIIRVARMKDCDNMLVSGTNGCDHGSFKIGKAKSELEKTYEMMTGCLSISTPKTQAHNIIVWPEASIA